MRPGTTQINSPSHGLAVVSARSRPPAPARRELPQYIPLPGEEIAAVRHAETYLVEFCAAGIAALPWELRPAATKCAVNYLVVMAMADEVRAELFLEPIAAAAGVTKTALRKQVADRCWYFRNFHRLYANRDTRQQVVDELLRMLAA